MNRLLRSYPVRLLAVISGVAVGAMLVAQLGLLTNEPTDTRQPSERHTAAAPERSNDAVLFVGRDIAPGTYQTAGAVDGRYCMWSRHSSATGGSMDDIIASDGTYSGQLIVTIEPTDVLFRTRGCTPWERVS